MSEQHTPGLLRLECGDSGSVAFNEDGTAVFADCPHGGIGKIQGQKNIRRAVACWNALVDIPTKEIEAAANYGASWGKTGLELAAVTVKLEQLRTENDRLRAELEAVGAGGVQPLRAESGWVLVPVEPTKEMRIAASSAYLDTHGYADSWIEAVYRAMLAAAPKAPKQAAPAIWWRKRADEIEAQVAMTGIPEAMRCFTDMRTLLQAATDAAPQQTAPVPPQKPELRVGQVWRTRGGGVAEIESETTSGPYPFQCVSGESEWTVTKDGNYYLKAGDTPDDLIKLISDVPQKGGEA